MAQRRIVSMEDPHLAAMETTIVPEDWSGTIEVRSALDGRVANTGVVRYRNLPGEHLTLEKTTEPGDPESSCVRTTTVSSGIGIAVAARTRSSAPAERLRHAEPGWAAQVLRIAVEEGRAVTVEKVAAVYTSRDRAIEEDGEAALAAVRRAGGFDALLERHELAWAHLWRRAQLSVDHADVQRVLNLHIFHLLQTVSPHTVELDAGVPARGLHGEAYRGHVFWDELFILPFLTMRFPEIARALLMYRCRRLPEARRAAAAAGRRGAMYPWQSAADGREETQLVHLNPRSGRWLPDHSQLQRHVGLTIAHNVWRFHEATGDIEFLAEYGAGIILEVARHFADLADNAYTNVLTAWVLRRALEALSSLVHAWILAGTDGDQAWSVFREALGCDMEDAQHGTTAEGVHLGAMAGTVDLVQRCYAGLSTRSGTLHLDPRLPSAIGELRLGLRYRGHWGIDLSCHQDRLRVSLRPGVALPIRIAFGDHDVLIQPGDSWETPLQRGRAAPDGG